MLQVRAGVNASSGAANLTRRPTAKGALCARNQDRKGTVVSDIAEHPRIGCAPNFD